MNSAAYEQDTSELGVSESNREHSKYKQNDVGNGGIIQLIEWYGWYNHIAQMINFWKDMQYIAYMLIKGEKELISIEIHIRSQDEKLI